MQRTIKIVTYPRTGSNYLYWLLSTSFGKNIFKSHMFDNSLLNTFIESDYIITVLRDPVDAISSFITMESFYWRNDKNLDEYLKETIPQRIEDYIYFYNTIKNHYNLFLDYKQINIFRNTLVKLVSDETNNEIVNYDNYVDLVKDNKNSYFLRTSKNNEEYNYIREKILKYDLIKCYEIYENCKLLTKNFIN